MEGIPHDIILEVWMKTKTFTREQLLTAGSNENKEIPLMFITTYNRTIPNFKEPFSKHWAYLGRSSATREFGKKDIMITYRKPPSLKDMLVRARLHNPEILLTRVVRDPIPANIARKFPNQEKSKTYKIIKPTIQWLRALARATTWYIAWNATGATQSM